MHRGGIALRVPPKTALATQSATRKPYPHDCAENDTTGAARLLNAMNLRLYAV